jgi:Flp pilus assembly protein TadD
VALWEATKDPGVMGDLLSFSIHAEFSEAVSALAYEAVKLGTPLTKVQSDFILELAHSHGQASIAPIETAAIGESPWQPFREPIKRLRALLKTEQRNPLALLDYAQLQAAVGKLDAAERAIRTALSLAPNNRIVLRTAARFYVHLGQPDHAHWLIRTHRRTPTDPWLMASEIALADASSSSSVMAAKGKRFLHDNKGAHPAHLTELAGAIAMQEIYSGNLKRAREAQRRALLAPNDNVVAQAVQMEKAFGVELQGPIIELAIANSSEARVLQAWIYGSPTEATQSAVEWHNEEPFSSRPIQILTSVLAYQGKLEQALHWLRAGLLADASDSGLLVNLAFVHARLKNYTEANSAIKKLRSASGSRSEPFALATEGLIQYQCGNFDSGDALYEQAENIFGERKDYAVEAFCRLNRAYFSIDNSHPRVTEIVAKTKDFLSHHMSFDCAMLMKIRDELTFRAPEVISEPTRRLNQWVFDPVKNTLTERSLVTAVGAPAFVMLPNAQKK